DTFAKLVPWLIGLSSLAILLPRPQAHPDGPSRDRGWAVGSVFGIAVYGGYFGAAAGVMLLALLLATTAETLPQATGFFVGGMLAPRAVRRMPAGPLRLVIAVAGAAIAIKLALQAY